MYHGIKYLSLVEVGLITNMEPLFIAVLSLLIMKEGMTRIEAGALLISFLGMCLFMFEDSTGQSESERLTYVIATASLLGAKLLMAGGFIIIRSMKGMYFLTPLSY